jgi:hypothetical protein
MTTRRGFLAAALAACAAPAYVKAGILMPVKKVWNPAWIGIDRALGGDQQAVWLFGAHGGDVYFSDPVRPYAFPIYPEMPMPQRWLDRAEAEALFAREAAKGNGIITIDARAP